jgi:flagellar basal-body rod protein FlgC
VDRLVLSEAEPQREYAPEHPQADAEGYVWHANVNVVEEMANMTSASRSYQSSVEVVSTVKRLMLATLRMGQ